MLILFAIVLFFYNTIIFNIAIAAMGLIATYELLNATKLVKYKGIAFMGASFAIVIPFAQSQLLRPIIPLIFFVLAFIFFILVIYYHNNVRFEQLAMALVFSTLVPLFFSSQVYMRDEKGTVVGLYYLLLAFGSAWFCDTGAFFAGKFLGKKKMAPNISPNKTVEGAVGGVVAAILLNLLFAFVAKELFSYAGVIVNMNYLAIAIASPFLAVVGIIGDLVASAIKREYNVKDYGHILPGHGGIMDRFDSVLLTLPTVYVLSRLMDFIVV